VPIFAGFLGALFAGLAEFLAGFVTRRVAVYAALVTVTAASWAALAVAVWAVVGVAAATVPTMVSVAFAFLFPSNLGTVIAGAIAIEGAVAGFRLHMGNVRAAAGGA
jgi:hypothetical protein